MLLCYCLRVARTCWKNVDLSGFQWARSIMESDLQLDPKTFRRCVNCEQKQNTMICKSHQPIFYSQQNIEKNIKLILKNL